MGKTIAGKFFCVSTRWHTQKFVGARFFGRRYYPFSHDAIQNLFALLNTLIVGNGRAIARLMPVHGISVVSGLEKRGRGLNRKSLDCR